MTDGTIDWYEELLRDGIEADSEVLSSLTLSQAMSILAMRSALGAELLDVADGRELFVIAVERGLVGDDVANTMLDRVERGDDASEAFGILDGFEVFRFERDDDEWRLDLTYTLRAMDENEAATIAALSGDPTLPFDAFLEQLASLLGSSWSELSQPLR